MAGMQLVKLQLLFVFGMLGTDALLLAADWPQFGGPRRDFTLPAGELPDAWPSKDGPKLLWKRPLRDGYSGISVAHGRAITVYEKSDAEDAVLAVDTKTGKTIWEFPISRKTGHSLNLDNGPGPHATPLIAGGRVFVTNTVGRLVALEETTGKLIWELDLWDKYGGVLDRGYGASALAWKDTIILPVGGKGHAAMAFNQADGRVVWQRGDSKATFSSPFLLRIGSFTQVAAFFGDEVAAFNPDNGDTQWGHPHKTDYNLNIAIPTYSADDGVMVLSSAYGGGSRGISLKWTGSKTEVTELWAHKKLRLHHNNALRIGDVVYASSGDFGPAPLTAVNVKDGKILWQDRALGKCSLVGSGNRALLLSEDGELALADLSPAGLKILTRAEVARNRAWTAPAVVDGVAYIRDRSTMFAVQIAK